MKNYDYIIAIDQAFKGMKERNEESIIVYCFEGIEQIILPSGGIMQCSFAKIIMECFDEKCFIKILYRDNNIYERLPFMSDIDKKKAVQMLRENNILPPTQEFLEARSLINSLSCEVVETMFHGDIDLA